MARPFMFAALCYPAHPLKHSFAESIFVSRVQKKTAKKIFVSQKIRYQGHTLAEVSLYIYIYMCVCVCVCVCVKYLFCFVLTYPTLSQLLTTHRYGAPKKQNTSGNLYKVVLEIQGWQDCSNLNILVCQVSKHTKPSRLMSLVTVCVRCGQTLISRPSPCALPRV